jgi:glycosyltransferase involved in cell wall biosynthesis
MDSSMPEQLIDRWKHLRIFAGFLTTFERMAVRRADITLTVCEYLSDKARAYAPAKTVITLEDIPLPTDSDAHGIERLRSLFARLGVLALYVGNLEQYQGIDLLLDGLARLREDSTVQVVVIGGSPADIARYKTKADRLRVATRCHFIGPRPVKDLSGYLSQADMLISPRLRGGNTPMKIYSYLASGKPIVATDIPSHTQVLDASTAILVKPEPEQLVLALERLASEPALRERLGRAGQQLAMDKYSPAVHIEKLLAAYALLDTGKPVSRDMQNSAPR